VGSRRAGDDGREVGAEAGGPRGGRQQALTSRDQGFRVVGPHGGTDAGQSAAGDDSEQFCFADQRRERRGVLRESMGERAVPGDQRPQFRGALRCLVRRAVCCGGEESVPTSV